MNSFFGPLVEETEEHDERLEFLSKILSNFLVDDTTSTTNGNVKSEKTQALESDDEEDFFIDNKIVGPKSSSVFSSFGHSSSGASMSSSSPLLRFSTTTSSEILKRKEEKWSTLSTPTVQKHFSENSLLIEYPVPPIPLQPTEFPYNICHNRGQMRTEKQSCFPNTFQHSVSEQNVLHRPPPPVLRETEVTPGLSRNQQYAQKLEPSETSFQLNESTTLLKDFQPVDREDTSFLDCYSATDKERHMLILLTAYLKVPEVNPFNGSVPIERLQNLMRTRHADLYNDVVGFRHNAWRRFLGRHQEEFALFSPENGKWRLALACNKLWQQGDKLERSSMLAKKHHLIECLLLFLESKAEHSCKVDEFRKAYPYLKPNLLEKSEAIEIPARGDLLRFIRTNPLFFRYDPITLTIHLNASNERN